MEKFDLVNFWIKNSLIVRDCSGLSLTVTADANQTNTLSVRLIVPGRIANAVTTKPHVHSPCNAMLRWHDSDLD